MPELPEVETLKRDLKVLQGKTIKAAKVNWPKMVKPLSPAKFCQGIKNLKITGVSRRAKVLILELSGSNFLLVHLKMTGQLIYQPKRGHLVVGGHPQVEGASALPNKYTRIIIYFKDGTVLYFNDLRKFGWLKLVDKKTKEKILADFGIEPLTVEFTLEEFKNILKRYPNRKIKQLLMDHKLIAGIGNIYADESCYYAKVLPGRIVKTLKPKEITDLHEGIKIILKLAIAKKGTSFRNYIKLNGRPGGMVKYLKVYGRGNQTCSQCGAMIKKIKLNGRGTHFCPQCQK
ncbi:MAG: DNA-formamidopyrimidine glycosylase [Patescibacteria group bacterium]|jgi:formamidopyrimidine-DNA glycosylase|nr:DNA-formamidopyrimidine glycosylase [Patescibacteria group bacterium]